MTETEKQEGQKTVVAFIAGLLIGGLLVWVFSASPETVPAESNTETDTENVSNDADGDPDETPSSDTNGSNDSADTSADANEVDEAPTADGDGELSVSNQPAGSVVVLDSISYPTEAGWVVVRDYIGGVSGRILGAARYNLTDRLLPESVNLLRATEAGSTYQVVFYSEDGDRSFNVSDDIQIEGSATALFEAE